MKKIFAIVLVLFSLITTGCGTDLTSPHRPGGMNFVDEDGEHPLPSLEEEVDGVVGAPAKLIISNSTASETVSYRMGDPYLFSFESQKEYRVTLLGDGFFGEGTVSCLGPSCPTQFTLSEVDMTLNYSGTYYTEKEVEGLVTIEGDAFRFTAKKRPTWYTFPWDTYTHQAVSGEYPLHRFMVGNDWEKDLGFWAIFFDIETEGSVSIEECRLDEVGVEDEEVRILNISNSLGAIDIYVDYVAEPNHPRHFTIWCRVDAVPGAKLRLNLHGFEAEGEDNRYFHAPKTEGPWITF